MADEKKKKQRDTIVDRIRRVLGSKASIPTTIQLNTLGMVEKEIRKAGKRTKRKK